MGGEKQRDISTYLSGYSETAQCIGNHHIWSLLAVHMQKPIEGLLALLKNIEDRSTIGEKHNQNHAENYLKGGYRQNGAQQSWLVVLFYAYHFSVAFEVVADALE